MPGLVWSDKRRVLQVGDAMYPFGIDPAWHGAKNELVYMNSMKMKISVVLGVTQMCLGLLLRVLNTWHERSGLDFLFECVPMTVFMVCFFGFMDYMILYKWVGRGQRPQSTTRLPTPERFTRAVDHASTSGGKQSKSGKGKDKDKEIGSVPASSRDVPSLLQLAAKCTDNEELRKVLQGEDDEELQRTAEKISAAKLMAQRKVLEEQAANAAKSVGKGKGGGSVDADVLGKGSGRSC
ncbi:unnamed protein product [Prorocentrum cordatum]|uniref:V-type proton ATPase subunit a n=1 Tax=Prorocentrum cordatum TaxID=2364126 RepID=A0ABN9Y026_9DINO|nr:unnamed protein product [Polarella glacialis]